MSPRVISLDSTGTLIKVSKSVGYHYVRILDKFFPGALSTAEKATVIQEFNQNFPLHYASAEKKHPNFGRGSIGAYKWWQGIVRELYLSSHIDIKDYQFSYIFQDTYEQFRTSHCWEPYPETLSTLQRLKDLGVDVVVTSDFDEGLSIILQDLGLFRPEDIANSLVKDVNISYEVGVKKPKLVGLIRDKWNVFAHVGDSINRDVAGAESAGIMSIFVDRDNKHNQKNSVASLEGLIKYIE